MAIFGRSKKSKSTSNVPLQPNPAALENQHYANYVPTNGNYAQQRPNTPHGHGQSYGYGSPPQAQGWQEASAPLSHSPNGFETYTPAPALPLRPKKSMIDLNKLKLASATHLLAASSLPDCPHLYQGAALYDSIASKFNAVVTQIDNGSFSGDEKDLAVLQPPQPLWQQEQQASGYDNQKANQGKSKGMVNNSVSSALTSTNYFSKVNLYANSRLPPNLPPMKL